MGYTFLEGYDTSVNVVNHIDEDRTNNNVNNLEIITQEDNVRKANMNGRKKSTKKAVCQYDKNGTFIARYSSINEAAAATNVSAKSLPGVCKNSNHTAGGYIWKYEDPENARKIGVPETAVVIDGYPNYCVTPCGKIYSKNIGRIMKEKPTVDGYRGVGLCRNGIKTDVLVHRIVAQHFIPNPTNLPSVNHKNYNTADNCVENLEWVDAPGNARHDHLRNRVYGKKVEQYDKLGNKIATYKNIADATKQTGVDNSSIVKTCKCKMRFAGGFTWKYVTDL